MVTHSNNMVICYIYLLVIVIVDASNKRTQLNLDKEILDILQSYPFTPSILVLNKVSVFEYKRINKY